MILKLHDKKRCENIIKFCKANGMEELSTMALWNTLVKLFKKIELLERTKIKKIDIELLKLQANAWEQVSILCIELGMQMSKENDGLTDVLDFIRDGHSPKHEEEL
jgi:hypothetical protein